MFLASPVPIIPSYLYTMDETPVPVVRNSTAAPQSSAPGSFQSIVSLYDNTVRVTGGNATAQPSSDRNLPLSIANTAVPSTPVAWTPQPGDDCPNSSKLLNENVKVGLLFASKATVQLITNPFIGPLTNR